MSEAVAKEVLEWYDEESDVVVDHLEGKDLGNQGILVTDPSAMILADCQPLCDYPL